MHKSIFLQQHGRQQAKNAFAAANMPKDVRNQYPSRSARANEPRYAEALSIMYRENHFAVTGPHRLSWLLRFHLFSRIRRLFISATCTIHRFGPDRLSVWRRWTTTLSRMPLLRELHVHIFFRDPNFRSDRRSMLESLGQIKQPTTYVVTEYHGDGVEVDHELDADRMPYLLRRGFLDN
jgi:hypothetical protein